MGHREASVLPTVELAQDRVMGMLSLATPEECLCRGVCAHAGVGTHCWAGPSRATYPDLLVEPQAAAIEDEVAIVEAT